MEKDYLVYLKENLDELVIDPNNRFKPHTVYRCSEYGDECVVNGITFNKKALDTFFEKAHTRIMRHFEMIGLVKDGKPISKKEFVEKSYQVKYGGRSKGAFWTLYFYTHPKECMYRFSPEWAGGSKAVVMTNFYDSFINLVNGDTQEVDDELIEYGNRGLPLGVYAPLKAIFIPEFSL